MKAKIEAKTNELETLTEEDRSEALVQMPMKERVAALKWWTVQKGAEYSEGCLQALAHTKGVTTEALEEIREKIAAPDEAQKMLAIPVPL